MRNPISLSRGEMTWGRTRWSRNKLGEIPQSRCQYTTPIVVILGEGRVWGSLSQCRFSINLRGLWPLLPYHTGTHRIDLILRPCCRYTYSYYKGVTIAIYVYTWQEDPILTKRHPYIEKDPYVFSFIKSMSRGSLWKWEISRITQGQY